MDHGLEELRLEQASDRLSQAEQLYARQMESVGQLAGGVAHDMNNILAAILVSAETLRLSFADGHPAARSLDNILYAGGRGRELVRTLAAFARQGLQETRAIDLNDLLRQELELLGDSILPQVQVVLELDPALPPMLGDAAALGGAIMNLCINALDAMMPRGGVLTLRSRDLRDGQVELAVADTGVGMTPEVLARATEPYFTTKVEGKGTGLGLARVCETVSGHAGVLDLRSEPGVGTTVVLRLPTIRENRKKHS